MTRMHSEQFSLEKFFKTENRVAGSALSAQTVPDRRGGVAEASPGARRPNKWLHQERLTAGTKLADRDHASECCFKSSWECALQRHIQTHTGEKPFTCTVCENKFFTRNDLKVHMMRHTGEKPFGCSECPRKFVCKNP